ncbi:MAG: hypothetical protein HYX68_25580 [Planctomycetes bacterium]|nr:hypothetical protein [Planctomycetota bacterium]
MKLRWAFPILLVAAACLLHPALANAGDKKKTEPAKKQKYKPFAPIIVNGELISADLRDKIYSGSYAKSFTFKMEKGRSYQIELGSTSFRAAVRLEDSTGKQLATAYDPFGNRQAVLVYDPTTTGDYQIIATTLNGNATGKFTLAVKDATGYSIFNVTDKLNQNDKAYQRAGGKKHKMYLVQMEAGKTYQIDMRSPNFDSYLYFEDPKGTYITQDDDGGGYPSARIIYKATQTGKFRVITTYFGGGGNLGEFTLTVRQTDGAAPGPQRFPFKDGLKKDDAPKKE